MTVGVSLAMSVFRQGLQNFDGKYLINEARFNESLCQLKASIILHKVNQKRYDI